MYQSAFVSGSAGHALIATALELASSKGVASISARALAERGGVSPSSVNYHFGSLENLLRSVSYEADQSRAAYWRKLAASLETLSPYESDFVPFVFSAIRSAVTEFSGEEAFFWNDVLLAARTGLGNERTSAILEERRFWQSLLKACGLDRLYPETLHSFVLAIRFGYLIHRGAAEFDPWGLALITQFGARAFSGGRPTDSSIRIRSERELSGMQAEGRSTHPTAKAILTATVELLLQRGAEVVTHRSVAKQANTSVSSVQHFFGARRTLLEAAFHEVVRQRLEQALPEAPKAGSISSNDLFPEKPDPARRSILPEFAAIQGLMVAASLDPQASGVARGMFAQSGTTSEGVLRALKCPRAAFGRLDAQIFSLTMNHLRTLEVGSGLGEEELDRKVGINLLTEFFEAQE